MEVFSCNVFLNAVVNILKLQYTIFNYVHKIYMEESSFGRIRRRHQISKPYTRTNTQSKPVNRDESILSRFGQYVKSWWWGNPSNKSEVSGYNQPFDERKTESSQQDVRLIEDDDDASSVSSCNIPSFLPTEKRHTLNSSKVSKSLNLWSLLETGPTPSLNTSDAKFNSQFSTPCSKSVTSGLLSSPFYPGNTRYGGTNTDSPFLADTPSTKYSNKNVEMRPRPHLKRNYTPDQQVPISGSAKKILQALEKSSADCSPLTDSKTIVFTPLPSFTHMESRNRKSKLPTNQFVFNQSTPNFQPIVKKQSSSNAYKFSKPIPVCNKHVRTSEDNSEFRFSNPASEIEKSVKQNVFQLKKGSVMDILGSSENKSLSDSTTSTTTVSKNISSTSEMSFKSIVPSVNEKVNNMDSIECANNSSTAKAPIDNVSNPLMNAFAKSIQNKWKCETCFVMNDLSVKKCVACGTNCQSRVENVSSSLQPPAEKINNPLMKAFAETTQNKWKCETCLVMNDLSKQRCVACESPRIDREKTNNTLGNASFDIVSNPLNSSLPPPADKTNNPLMKAFAKTTENKWQCNTCLIMNELSKEKCQACDTPRAGISKSSDSTSRASDIKKNPLIDAFAKSNKWKCDVCLIMNELSKDKCAACESPKPGSVKVGNTLPSFEGKNPLFDIFAKNSHNKWKCDTCFVMNDLSIDKCVACTATRPGTNKVTSSKSNTQAPVWPNPFSLNSSKPSNTETASLNIKASNTVNKDPPTCLQSSSVFGNSITSMSNTESNKKTPFFTFGKSTNANDVNAFGFNKNSNNISTSTTSESEANQVISSSDSTSSKISASPFSVPATSNSTSFTNVKFSNSDNGSAVPLFGKIPETSTLSNNAMNTKSPFSFSTPSSLASNSQSAFSFSSQSSSNYIFGKPTTVNSFDGLRNSNSEAQFVFGAPNVLNNNDSAKTTASLFGSTISSIASTAKIEASKDNSNSDNVFLPKTISFSDQQSESESGITKRAIKRPIRKSRIT